MKFSLAVGLLTACNTGAFTPPSQTKFSSVVKSSTAEEVEIALVDERTGKPTGNSFLPEETIARARVGNPGEKAKIAKDATSAWVDVYDYAAKIRNGELTWEEVEKADLDTVCSSVRWYGNIL